jgi:circadian clock protein KaiB
MAAKKVVKKAGKKAEVAASTAASNHNGWNLRLYVAGDSPRSRSALANLQRLCEARLKDNYHIEVIDLTKRPDLAKADQILAVPTLIRKIPEPMKRVIGDLSNADRALVALDMHSAVAGEGA